MTLPQDVARPLGWEQMASPPGPTEAETALSHARAIVLRERADDLLRSSVNAGDAGLWGETIRHAMVEAGLALHADASRLEGRVQDQP